MSRLTSPLGILLRGAVAVGLLATIFFLVRRTEGEIPWGPGLVVGLVVAAGCVLVAQLLGALRWRILLGKGAPPWSRLAQLYLGAAFFSVFLPSTAGGDAYRAAAISKILESVPNGVMSTFVDRAFGLVALGVWFLVGVGIFAVDGTAYPSLAGLETSWHVLGAPAAIGVLALAILVRSQDDRVAALRGALRRAVRFISSNLAGPRPLVAVLLLSMLLQGFYILGWVALAMGAGIEVSVGFLILTVPVVSVLTMLPVTISGLGVREGIWVLLTRGLGVPLSEVVVFSLSYFVAFALVGVLGGLLLLRADALGFSDPSGN